MRIVKETDRLKDMDEEQILEAALNLPKDAQLGILEALLEGRETSAQDSEKQKGGSCKIDKGSKEGLFRG